MKRTLAIGALQLCTAACLLGQMAGMATTPRPGGEDSRHQSLERDLYQGCRADRAAALPGLPSSGRGHAVLHDDVRRNAALGGGDEADGGHPGHAALV